MRFFAALAALLFIPATALAGPCSQFRGASAYPAMSPAFNSGGACDALLAIDDRACRPGMPILWKYFGDDPTCPARFTARYADWPHLLEIHFSNEACRKSRTCWLPRSYLPGFDEHAVSQAFEAMEPLTRQGIVDRLNEILAFVEQVRVPNTEIALSIGLEESFSARARTNLIRVVRENWPYDIVATGAGADFREFHTRSGPSKGACYANEDGLKQEFSQTRKFFSHYRRCRAVFAFRDRWQGRVGSFHGHDPAERTFVVTRDDVKRTGDILAR